MITLSRLKKLFSIQSESEKALIVSEKRYHDFITSSQDWIWECDAKGYTSYSNQAVTNILGYTPEELSKISVLDLIHKDDLIDVDEMFSECVSTKKGWYNKLFRWKTKHGQWRYLESSSVVMFDDNGNLSGFRGIDRDVTKRIEVEKAYREGLKTLNNAFDATPDGVSITRLSDGRFIYANPALAEMSKCPLEEIIGKTIYELNFYHDPRARKELIKKLLSGKMVSDFQTDFRSKEGEIIPGSVSCSLVELDDEKCIISILRNISDRRAAESELRKLSTAIEQSHDAIYITNTKGVIEYVNSRLTDLTGYDKEELIGSKPSKWKSGVTNSKVYDVLYKTIISGKVWNGELLNRKKNGECYWASENITPIIDPEGKVSHYLGSQEDITEIRNLNQQLDWQASYDGLTGLVNRKEFERRLERIVTNFKNNANDKHALFFMDLDQFKVINDTCGHTAGDELLRQMSNILQRKVRKQDTLARIGGDEFAILMEHCSVKHAQRVANNLLNAVQEYQFQWNQKVLRVGVSIGLVPITDNKFSTTDLLKNADIACYLAKDQGRNRIHIYHFEDEDLVRKHGEMNWVAQLYQALNEDRFSLYAQSIIKINKRTSKQSTCYELLLRMIDDQGKIISPDQFFPAAEHYNLATKLDKWVVQQIFDTLTVRPELLQHVEFISINLSGSSLTDNEFLNFIVNHLSKNIEIIDLKKLCFEITETAAITHLTKASNFISRLKSMGCKFALDDFGSGLSSFGYLKNLPVDYLKIDGMFVKDIVDDQIDHAMVKSINEIGHVMKMKTIAEYVENDEIKGMLREIGVDYAQGYGISMPVPLDKLLNEHETKMNNVIKLNPDGKTA
ncbi:MAG: PAS domain S-box protein [Proteobacteria bacterium]|nr:EAL domain-containing protein [Pseudomonadota bacterium]NOG59532.1 PAS domain S-box protein [Pseudomonadota bacterium]